MERNTGSPPSLAHRHGLVKKLVTTVKNSTTEEPYPRSGTSPGTGGPLGAVLACCADGSWGD